MTTKIIFLVIMIVLSYIDHQALKIPNVIVLPAIFLGMILTHDVLWSLIMFTSASMIYAYSPNNNKFMIEERDRDKYDLIICGGDVKLFAMIGAFMGIKSIAIIVLTFGLVKLYRLSKLLFYRHLPLTPFALAASVPFLFF